MPPPPISQPQPCSLTQSHLPNAPTASLTGVRHGGVAPPTTLRPPDYHDFHGMNTEEKQPHRHGNRSHWTSDLASLAKPRFS